jgi:hypothetical protein
LLFKIINIATRLTAKKVELAVLEVIQREEPKNNAALAGVTALECYSNNPELRDRNLINKEK